MNEELLKKIIGRVKKHYEVGNCSEAITYLGTKTSNLTILPFNYQNQ